jgi:pyruvate kinase
MDSYDGMIPVTRMLLRKHALAEAGEPFVVTAGVPFNVPGTTNLLKVETV